MKPKSINYQCKEFRESLGLSQAQFALKHKMLPSQVARFEQGRSKNMFILLEYMKEGFEPPLESGNLFYDEFWGD